MATSLPQTDMQSPLTDRFGRRHTYLRVSVTDRCNLRCRYCMPAEGIQWIERKDLLSFEEIERIVRALAGAGVNKVRITGGEPTVRRGIEGLIAALAKIEGIEELAMTTNGTTLPKMAQTYRDAGLTHLNVSLDSLDAAKYKEITLHDKFDVVINGIERAIEVGFAPLKVNVVAMKGVNDDEIPAFVEFARHRPVNVRFIEFMPFDGNEWTQGRMLSYREMVAIVGEHCAIEPLPHRPNQVAKDFRIVGGAGTISFVTSMTDDFCSECNRIRLTATGEFKPCLFMLPNVSVRDVLRNGGGEEEVLAAAHASLDDKWAGHPGPQNLIRLKNASMIQIGG